MSEKYDNLGLDSPEKDLECTNCHQVGTIEYEAEAGFVCTSCGCIAESIHLRSELEHDEKRTAEYGKFDDRTRQSRFHALHQGNTNKVSRLFLLCINLGCLSLT